MKTVVSIAVSNAETGHVFEWNNGDVFLDGQPLRTVASPQRCGTDFWTAERPYVKICSVINGSFVWWVPSLKEFLENRQEKTGGDGK